MQILVIAIGKIKEDYLKRGIEDYKNRLSKYAKVKIVELAEEDISLGPAHEVKAREAQKILKRLPKSGLWYVIALDRKGTELDSEQLSKKINSLLVSGRSDIAFIIGGALGLDDSVIQAADFSLSLSRLTFPHQVARFILFEQLYRSFKIIKGEPYHK
ncbi:MAG: 23S rRNA (pseudouridine(1915)-N(3))-methyltransferase RlmH [Actinomycetota bacterium]